MRTTNAAPAIAPRAAPRNARDNHRGTAGAYPGPRFRAHLPVLRLGPRWTRTTYLRVNGPRYRRDSGSSPLRVTSYLTAAGSDRDILGPFGLSAEPPTTRYLEGLHDRDHRGSKG